MLRHMLFTACVVVVLGGLVWPGPALIADRIEPRLFGLPFGLCWVVGWVLVAFVGLWFYERGHEAT